MESNTLPTKREKLSNGESWPDWAYTSKREWKKDVRKRWIAFKKSYSELRAGCVFFPTDFVYNLDIKEADKKMKDWYKKA